MWLRSRAFLAGATGSTRIARAAAETSTATADDSATQVRPSNDTNDGTAATDPAMMSLIRRHMRLPLAHDVSRVIEVLEDWHRYCYDTPLQEKRTFPAELWVRCHMTETEDAGQRSASSSSSSSASPLLALANGVEDKSSSGSSARTLGERVSCGLSALWQSTSGNGAAGNDGEDKSRRGTPHGEHVRRFPLQLWPAVLPWEVQKGLSLSRLRLPEQDKVTEEEQRNGEHAPAEATVAEEDPFGVVSGGSATTSDTADTPKRSAAGSDSDGGNKTAATATPPPSFPAETPGMLFVMGAGEGAAPEGLHFWSGAIVEPIDVLFCGYAFPAIIARNHSFQKLMQQNASRAGADKGSGSGGSPPVSRKIIRRYFPLKEYESSLQNNAEDNGQYDVNGSGASARLTVSAFGHLDPFPGVQERYGLPVVNSATLRGNAAASALKFTISSQEGLVSGGAAAAAASPPSAPEAYAQPTRPSMVLEAPYAFLRTCVQRALREVQGPEEASSSSAPCSSRVGGVEVELRLSSQMTRAVLERCHISCEYVADMERFTSRYLKLLNTPFYYDAPAAAAGHDEMPRDPTLEDEDGEEEGGAAGSAPAAWRQRKMQVWVSEKECVYMTLDEIRARQRENSRKARETPRQAAAREMGAADTDDEYGAEGGEEEAERVSVEEEGEPQYRFDSADAGEDEDEDDRAYLAAAEPAAGAVAVVQGGGGGGGDQLLARKSQLARSMYPATSARVPLLPPIHYELFYYCLLLGLCRDEAFYFYYPRILREFQGEHQRLRQYRRAAKGAASEQAPPPPPPPRRVSAEDMALMLLLVRDVTLQLPGELVSLVEATARETEAVFGTAASLP